MAALGVSMEMLRVALHTICTMMVGGKQKTKTKQQQQKKLNLERLDEAIRQS